VDPVDLSAIQVEDGPVVNEVREGQRHPLLAQRVREVGAEIVSHIRVGGAGVGRHLGVLGPNIRVDPRRASFHPKEAGARQPDAVVVICSLPTDAVEVGIAVFPGVGHIEEGAVNEVSEVGGVEAGIEGVLRRPDPGK